MFGTLATTPLLVWVIHNALVAPNLVGNRMLTWHSISAEHLWQVLPTALDWFVPSSVGARLMSGDGVVGQIRAGLFCAAILGVLCWRWTNRARRTVIDGDLDQRALRRVLLTFVVVYPASIVLSMLLVDDLIQLDSRILSPVYVCLVIFLSGWVPRVLRNRWQVPAVRMALAAIVFTTAATYGVRFGAVVQRAHVEGVMYSNVPWLSSPTMNDVRDLSGGITLYSNASDAIYILANRSAHQIPHVGNTSSFVATIGDALRRGTTAVVIAYFDDENIAYRKSVPVETLQGLFSVRLIARTETGGCIRSRSEARPVKDAG